GSAKRRSTRASFKEDSMRLHLRSGWLFALFLGATPLLQAQPQLAQQEQVIAEIKKLKGDVKRDASQPDKPVVGVDLHGTRITDVGLEHLQSLTKLQTLNLYNTSVTDAGLVHLQRLTSLTTLYLNNTQVTDAGLVHLKSLARLQQLALY